MKLVYVSEDGKEFKTEEECIAYESSYSEISLEEFVDGQVTFSPHHFKTSSSFRNWLIDNHEFLISRIEVDPDVELKDQLDLYFIYTNQRHQKK